MISFRLCAFVSLAAFAFTGAAAQSGGSVKILQLPAGFGPKSAIVAERPLMVAYNGKLDPARKIYVRVFRDSLQALTDAYPRATPRGQCVVYAHTARFPVLHGSDGQLRINDVVDFFANATGQRKQEMTLVFEEGEDANSGGPLRLYKNDVARYFANAMPMTLLASDITIDAWDRKQSGGMQAASIATAKKPWWPFSATVVHASSAPSAAPVPVSHVDVVMSSAGPTPAAPAPVTVCERLTILPFVPMKMANDNAGTQPEILAPVAESNVKTCSEWAPAPLHGN